jgi:hypothetical protein
LLGRRGREEDVGDLPAQSRRHRHGLSCPPEANSTIREAYTEVRNLKRFEGFDLEVEPAMEQFQQAKMITLEQTERARLIC